MNEQQTLKLSVMSDPNILAFLVYADYLDENGLDSLMWRNPYSPIVRMVVDDGYVGGGGGGYGGGLGGGWGDGSSHGGGNSKSDGGCGSGDGNRDGGGYGYGNLFNDNHKLL